MMTKQKKKVKKRERVLSMIQFVPVCCVAAWVIMESPHRSAEDQTQDEHRRRHMKERSYNHRGKLRKKE